MELILLNILEVSLGGALVIALMLLIAPLAGTKFSAKWRYWIWLALAIRLLLPFDFSLPNPPLTIEVPRPLTVEQSFAPKAEPDNGFLQGEAGVPAISTESTNEDIAVETEPITPMVSVETQEAWQPTVLELLALVWMTGTAVSLIWQGGSYARWQRDCRLWNRPVEDGNVLNGYYDLCRQLGISKFPRLMRNRRVQSPMMIGLLEPAILLPQMDYSEEDYAVVLTHELNHYKRRDLWYKLLMLVTRCVHWFNPLVWLMLREADNDLEITCDEAVVKNHGGDDRALYCEAILRIMCRGKGRYALLSTGFNGGKKVLQRRFTAVLNEKASRGFVLGAMAMVLVLLCGGLVACELTERGQEADMEDTTLSAEQTEDENLREELLASLVRENYPQASEAALQNLKDYLADKDLQSIKDTLNDQQYLNYLLRDEYWGIESQETTAEEKPTEQERQNTESSPSVSASTSSVASGSGSNRYKPFTQSFRGLDVHATDQYETLNYYTTDSSAIAAIMKELDWENKQPAAAKKELYTHDVALSGQFIRLITDNMEQLYVYQDHDQALYRDKAGNRTYYDVDERTYDDLFGVIDEVNRWKKNPVTDSRSGPFNENYATLDLYVSDQPDSLSYTLTIRTFCEMLIDDLNWEEVAEKVDVIASDYLSPVDLSDGHYVRISTNTGRHLYIYKDHPYGVYYTGHGIEHYYRLSSGTYERIYSLLQTYSVYRGNAPLDVFPFQRDFTNVTVSFYKDGKEENKLPLSLDREESFRMMAGIPTGYFVRAEKKEELTLDQGTFVLIENFDGQKLAFYEGKTQVKYWSADGKVAYYELGADYYDIARMVAEEQADWEEVGEAITLTPTADYWLVGTEEIQLVLENKTKHQLYGSESFQLEQWKDDKWVKVKHPDSTRKRNPDIGVVYEPQSKNTILVDLTERFGELAAGDYRLTMTSVTPNLSAEFELLEGTYNVLTIMSHGSTTSLRLYGEGQKSFIQEVFLD